MSARDESDSDAPEEFTADQGIELDAEIRKIQKENKSRITREGKERRRKWAERKTPRSSKKEDKEEVKEAIETEEEDEESASSKGMLPNNIVQLLAAREKKVFSAKSDDDDDEKTGSGAKLPTRKKKKARGSGPHTVILNEVSPPPCLQNALEFLKENKMRVARSSAVLNNSNQALRLISASGLLSKN